MIIQIIFLISACVLVGAQYEDEVLSTTLRSQPYRFAFTAGRYPGHIDRTRAEYGDDNGIVRGLYTYVDPRQEVRAVEYTADKDGFHPVLNIPAARDTPAVIAARSRHLKLFNEIARNNRVVAPPETRAVAEAKRQHALLYARIAEDHARIAAELKAAQDLAAQTESNSDVGEVASVV